MSYLGEKIVAAAEWARKARQRRLIWAQMHSDRFPVQDIIIRNISSSGIGGASRGLRPKKDERVTVLLPDGQAIAGVVRWVDGQSFGIELDHDLDPQAMADSIQRQMELANASTNWEVRRLHRVPQPTERSNLRRI